MDTNYTALVLLIDRSGSMLNIYSEMENGLNHMIQEQSMLPGTCTVDAVLFDDRYEEILHLATAGDAIVKMKPRGMTALYDSLTRKIHDFGKTLANFPEDARPGKVLFVVATDGLDNTSRSSAQSVKELVQHQTDKYGWNFVFMGANQDAVLSGTNLGFAAHSSITYDGTSIGTQSATSALSGYTTRLRTGGSAKFSEEERNASKSGKP